MPHVVAILLLVFTQVEDAITGNKLRIVDQTVHVGVASQSGASSATLKDVNCAHKLADLLAEDGSSNRSEGTFHSQPVLIRAEAGAGKTWLLLQVEQLLARKCLDLGSPLQLCKCDSVGSSDKRSDGDRGRGGGGGGKGGGDADNADKRSIGGDKSSAGGGAKGAGQPQLVPLVVLVQRLAPLLQRHQSYSEPGDLTLLERYIREYESDHADALLMALDMRLLVLLVDGLDEGARLKEAVEHYVVRVACVPAKETETDRDGQRRWDGN